MFIYQPLDRDAPYGSPTWKLRIQVTDGFLQDETLVHVNLKDVNDNKPFFSKTSVTAQILENSPKGNEYIFF